MLSGVRSMLSLGHSPEASSTPCCDDELRKATVPTQAGPLRALQNGGSSHLTRKDQDQ